MLLYLIEVLDLMLLELQYQTFLQDTTTFYTTLSMINLRHSIGYSGYPREWQTHFCIRLCH